MGSVQETYSRHCAACHGPRGRGDGELAAWLWPAPRAFTAGAFNLVSTRNGVPTDDDLAGVIARGMPGSAMPAFAWLDEETRHGLVDYVRALAVEGLAERYVELAGRQGIDLSATEARARAQHALTPGQGFAPLQPVAAASAEVLERGRSAYLVGCAACHGEDGRGRALAEEWSHFEVRLARDFTSGILKGGAGADDLALRIRAGMPAAGMPPSHFDDADLGALVAYVQTLIPAGSDQRLVAGRETVRAARVAALPEGLDDSRWQPQRIVLSPLAWHREAIVEVEIAALHDGAELALLVRWADATRDAAPLEAPAPDAVAIQLSAEAEPPFLAMGDARAAVDIWQWQAFSPRAVAGGLDLVAARRDARTDAMPSAAPLRGVAASRAVRAAGSAAARFADAGRPLAAAQGWRDGRWSVVFRRALDARAPGETELRPGSRLHFACAAWNGSAGERRANKSVSAWQVLELDE
jgi:DMSO reductase family type II enzyme heme b subunit